MSKYYLVNNQKPFKSIRLFMKINVFVANMGLQFDTTLNATTNTLRNTIRNRIQNTIQSTIRRLTIHHQAIQ